MMYGQLLLASLLKMAANRRAVASLLCTIFGDTARMNRATGWREITKSAVHAIIIIVATTTKYIDHYIMCFQADDERLVDERIMNIQNI